MNQYEMMTEEQRRLRTEWADLCDEKDNQSAIRLANLALWTAFTICDGGK